jgi:hypothetical protein
MLMTPATAALPIMDYVAQENARRQAAGEGFLLVSDPAFYVKGGIRTAGDWELASLKAAYADTYKEVRGFRPRGTLPPNATAADIIAAIRAL